MNKVWYTQILSYLMFLIGAVSDSCSSSFFTEGGKPVDMQYPILTFTIGWYITPMPVPVPPKENII